MQHPIVASPYGDRATPTMAVSDLPGFMTMVFRGLSTVWRGRHRLSLCWPIGMRAVSPRAKALEERTSGPQPPSPPGVLAACSQRPMGTYLCPSVGWCRLSWPPCRRLRRASCLSVVTAATLANVGPSYPMAQKGRHSKHHPWFVGRFVQLLAA